LVLGGPKEVTTWRPPGSKVTVRVTKSVLLPERTKCQPSWLFGMVLQVPWPLNAAAVIGRSLAWCRFTVEVEPVAANAV